MTPKGVFAKTECQSNFFQVKSGVKYLYQPEKNKTKQKTHDKTVEFIRFKINPKK
jgi:hypothetical protein